MDSHLQKERKMKNRRFVGAEEVVEDFGVSRAKAYRMIKQMNNEMEKMGYLTVAGRISRKYYYERTYGDFESEKGGDNACI